MSCKLKHNGGVLIGKKRGIYVDHYSLNCYHLTLSIMLENRQRFNG